MSIAAAAAISLHRSSRPAGWWRPLRSHRGTFFAERGAFCVGRCWGLMVILFTLGVMSLAWMGIVTALIFAQMVLPHGEGAQVPLAVALLAFGVWIAFDAGSVPLLHVPAPAVQPMPMYPAFVGRVKVSLMSMGDGELLSIGEVARRSGKPASAIRYYEEVSLLPPPVRVSGKRRYEPGVVRTLAVVETAQRAGLSLDEIRLLLEASPEDAASTERLREVAQQKLPALREAIARAQIVAGWLEVAEDCCCPTLDDCPLFDEPSRLPERSLLLR